VSRILLITNVVASYRIPLYERLARLPEWNLLVAHGSNTGEAGVSVAEPSNQHAFKTALLVNFEACIRTLTVRWQRGLLGVVRSFRPDVVIASGEIGNISSWIACAWARVAGRPVVLWTSAWEPQQAGSSAYRFKRLAMRLYFRLADRILVYSSKARRDLLDLGMSEDRLTVCHNGLDVAHRLQREPDIRAAAAALRQSEGIEDRMLFLSVGRAVEAKRLDLLVTAFTESPACQQAMLWVVGEGPALPALESRVAAGGASNIKFWGSVYAGVDAYFAAADCFVLPGLGGLALNEAMLFGLPCICSVADGTEDDLVVDGVTGVRFAPGEASSLAAAFEHVIRLKERGRLRQIGDAARARLLDNHTVDQMVRTFQATVPLTTSSG
jgi:glycosyltransferase involved in cell wall biosynthesis